MIRWNLLGDLIEEDMAGLFELARLGSPVDAASVEKQEAEAAALRELLRSGLIYFFRLDGVSLDEAAASPEHRLGVDRSLELIEIVLVHGGNHADVINTWVASTGDGIAAFADPPAAVRAAWRWAPDFTPDLSWARRPD